MFKTTLIIKNWLKFDKIMKVKSCPKMFKKKLKAHV